MSKTLIIAKRELQSLFYSPVAYVALVVFAVIAGVFFLLGFGPGLPAEMRTTLTYLVWLLVFIAPALSMGLLSEESRSGTIELLLTSPINDVAVVLGKWLGALGFFLVLLVPVLAAAIVLEMTASPDWGPIISGLIGVVLVGGLYLAIGLWISAMTRNQFVAWLLTIVATGFLTIGLYLVNFLQMPGWLREAIFFVRIDLQFGDFAKGLIDIRNFLFFASGIALFLFLAVLTLQSRRWR